MPNESEEDERLRLLNEMRAYGKTTPFAHTAPPVGSPQRENVYDASMREWIRSRTFKVILWITCIIPAIAMCLFFALTIGGVTWGGFVILKDIERILGGGY